MEYREVKTDFKLHKTEMSIYKEALLLNFKPG